MGKIGRNHYFCGRLWGNKLLIGQYLNSVDDKGRLLIPSKFRNEIAGDRVVVAPGLEQCLRLYTPDAWKVVVEEIMSSGSTFQKETRKLLRALLSPASECEIDKAGRILVPQNLREKVALVDKVLVQGVVEYIELWNPDLYEEWMSDSDEEILGAAEKIGEFFANKKKDEVDG